MRIILFNKRSSFAIKLSGLLIIFYLLTGCALIPKEEEVLAPPLKEPPKVTYSLIDLKKGVIEKKILCTGYFISVQQKDLSFKNRSGRLKTIYVKAGDKVKSGDLLAELQADSLEVQIKQQEIALKKLGLTYELMKANGQKDIELSHIQVESLKKQLGNMNAMPDVYSDEQIDSMKEQLAEAEILYRNAKSVYDTNLKTVENDMEAGKLQLNNLQKELKDTKIISPVDGTVDYKTDSKEGDLVDAYKTIVRVADPRELQILYSEDKVSNFEVGMKVRLESNDRKYEGTVVMTPSNVPQDADEKLKKSIRIEPDRLPEGVSIGDSVTITLVLERRENAIVIPGNLVHTLGERKYVHVLENGLKKERDIEPGIEAQTEIEVLKGLSEEDKLIND